MTYGGIITSLKVPDRYRDPGEVVLGHSRVESYLRNAPYFGAIIGRYPPMQDEVVVEAASDAQLRMGCTQSTSRSWFVQRPRSHEASPPASRAPGEHNGTGTAVL
jgi:hypothetical protein